MKEIMGTGGMNSLHILPTVSFKVLEQLVIQQNRTCIDLGSGNKKRLL